jgi:N-acetylglucosaminyldiphosphoundecaprenol N-acetyl-beta-D-mannosaminyltransferase
VVLSLGAPKQDMVLAAVSGQFKNLTVMTSGGFIEQISEALVYYPALIDRLNLRWLYRAYRMRSLAKVIQVSFGLALLARQFRARSQKAHRS